MKNYINISFNFLRKYTFKISLITGVIFFISICNDLRRFIYFTFMPLNMLFLFLAFLLFFLSFYYKNIKQKILQIILSIILIIVSIFIILAHLASQHSYEKELTLPEGHKVVFDSVYIFGHDLPRLSVRQEKELFPGVYLRKYLYYDRVELSGDPEIKDNELEFFVTKSTYNPKFHESPYEVKLTLKRYLYF